MSFKKLVIKAEQEISRQGEEIVRLNHLIDLYNKNLLPDPIEAGITDVLCCPMDGAILNRVVVEEGSTLSQISHYSCGKCDYEYARPLVEDRQLRE